MEWDLGGEAVSKNYNKPETINNKPKTTDHRPVIFKRKGAWNMK